MPIDHKKRKSEECLGWTKMGDLGICSNKAKATASRGLIAVV